MEDLFPTLQAEFTLLAFSSPCLLSTLPPLPGDASGEEGHGRAVRNQDPEEGHHHPGRRRGVHHGGEESAGHGTEAAFPRADAFLLSDHGEILM